MDMKARTLKKIAGGLIASVAFVLLCGEGCRYEPSWLASAIWMLLLFLGSWMMELQNLKPIREKLAEFDRKGEEE